MRFEGYSTVGRPNGGLSAPATAANVQVRRRAAGQPATHSQLVYQFPDQADARATRTVYFSVMRTTCLL